MTGLDKRATVVLVHGAWADGSSWSKVISPLRDLNFNVFAAPIPMTSFGDDIQALERALARTTGSVVLVGHAYAGAVVCSSAHERVRSIVLVAALAPAVGETVADVFYREDPHPMAPALKPDEDGFIWMPEEGFSNAFAQNAPEAEKRLLAAIQRPIHVSCIQEKIAHAAWTEKPSWYLVAEQDRMIRPCTQRFMAERMGARIRSIDADHAPAITAPRSVVEIIAEAVTHHELPAPRRGK